MGERENASDPRAAFLEEAVRHGPIEPAEQIRAAHPDIARNDIHIAAILGDVSAIQAQLAEEPARATAKDSGLGWDPLTYLCFSKYLRFRQERSAQFIRAAEILMDAGASTRTGFLNESHGPGPVFERALCGAAGVAHHAALTRLLLDRGADPNDDEVPYHAPESHETETLSVLSSVASFHLTASPPCWCARPTGTTLAHR